MLKSSFRAKILNLSSKKFKIQNENSEYNPESKFIYILILKAVSKNMPSK